VVSDSADDANSRENLSKYYIVLCVACAADVRTVSVVGIYIYIYICKLLLCYLLIYGVFNEAVHIFDFVALMVQ
jgi:hypothetical protein